MSKRQDAKEIRGILDDILKASVSEKELLEEHSLILPAGQRKMTRGELLAFKLIERGCKGDLMAIREVLDRLYGKPVQTNENINANISYSDFLLSIVEKGEMDKYQIPASPVIEVTGIPIPESLPPAADSVPLRMEGGQPPSGQSPQLPLPDDPIFETDKTGDDLLDELP